MEPRSAIGEWKPDEDRFVLTTGSQGVHGMRDIIAGKVFKIAPEKLRVITPDVGGGFGPKAFVYREYPLVLEAAKRLGRPVKWTGDRTEHFLADAQGRDNYRRGRDGAGRATAASWRCRVDLTANLGAYISQYGPFIPYIGATMSTGVYDIQALDVTINGVYTNTCPVDAYRGAGRPEAAFLLEKLVDACARELGMAREEIRRRNFIRPEQFPVSHRDRPALRRRRVRRPHDAGHGAGRLGELRRAARRSRRRPARSAASAWRPISRPAPFPAPSRPSCSSTATAR